MGSENGNSSASFDPVALSGEKLKLAACPFCDEPPLQDPQRVSDRYRHVAVYCDNCGIEGPAKVTDLEAITAWNTRQEAPAPQAGDVEVLFEHDPTDDVTIPGSLFRDMHAAYVAAQPSPDEAGLREALSREQIARLVVMAEHYEALAAWKNGDPMLPSYDASECASDIRSALHAFSKLPPSGWGELISTVLAMYDEYNRDEECDHTKLNRLIEDAGALAAKVSRPLPDGGGR